MKRSVVLLLFGWLVPGVVLAQTAKISGAVFDSDTRLPLAGANVIIEELMIGAATTINGEYVIDDVPVGTYTIRTSFVGFRTDEFRLTVIEGDATHIVRLEVDYAKYDELVVTGVASRRSRATSDVAVGRIDAIEPLRNNSYQEVSQLVNGRVAGVIVQPSSGNVATGLRFIMRAAAGAGGVVNQPLVYVDGARVSHYEENWVGVGGQGVSQLAHLNPEDIERIDILKGPAGAALYGTSAAGGVVLITTKRGSLGSGVRQESVPLGVTYEGTLGSNRQAKDYTVFMSATPDATNAIFRNGGLSEHQLTANGGSESVRYYASFGSRREDGHVLGSSQNRQSFRANFDAFPSNLVTLQVSTAFVSNDVERPQNDWNASGWLQNTLVMPTPYVLADSTAIANAIDVQRVTRFTGSTQIEYRPIKGITTKAVLGYDRTDLRNDDTKPAGFRYSFGTTGSRLIADVETAKMTFDLNARYDYALTTSLTGATTVGIQGNDDESRRNRSGKVGFDSDASVALQGGSDVTRLDEYSTNTREMGVFGIQDFAYDEKVFVTLGIRRDYASTFGNDAPSILYPRASAALRLDNLLALPSQLPFLKIRAAYGEAGRLPTAQDAEPALWTIFSGGYGPAADPSGWGNPEIQPERTKEFETGLEAGFLSNRLSLELNYYRQWAENNIVYLENPPSSGIGRTPFNVASATGWGVESMLTATPIRSSSTSLDVTFMWNWMNNEVVDLGGGAPSILFATAIKEGLPREAYYAWRSEASFNADGSYAGPKLVSTPDGDGDGIPDREYLGVPYPKQNGSLQFTLRFLRNFYLSGLADWQLGYSNMSGDRYFRVANGTDARRNIALVQIGQVEDPCEVWLCNDSGNLKSEFADMNVQALPVGSEEYRAAAEVVAGTEEYVDNLETVGNFVENASFLNLREMSLRYDFSQMLARRFGGKYVRSLSLTIAGRNLFTATPFSGADPVGNMFGAEFPFAVHHSTFTLPSPRVIYARVSLGI